LGANVTLVIPNFGPPNAVTTAHVVASQRSTIVSLPVVATGSSQPVVHHWKRRLSTPSSYGRGGRVADWLRLFCDWD
jgi:hypothetical protein